MSLTPGVRIGAYEVIALIGTGGMGEVYRARDSRLQRDVALKILPEMFAADRERLARFEREARTLAVLNHPNIAQIYGLETDGNTPALAMELVDGPTLADRIARGALPADEVLSIATQLSDALEAAHEHGIVHRDLKPANVKVRPDGTVKVLDFGLAKAVEDDRRADVSQSPTLSVAATRLGVILGTAAYMSPEQARGKAVDKRTDIWAFGCVLYEMVTGRRAFGGDEVADILGAVIHKEPDWRALPEALSPSIHAVVRGCLQKDRRQRLRDAGDVRLMLDGAAHGPTPQRADATVAPGTRHRRMLVTATAATAGAVIAGIAVWAVMRQPSPPVARLIAEHLGPGVVGGFGPDVAIAADGARIAYMTTGGGARQIHVRAIDELIPRRLVEGELSGLFMSPDGAWVGFADGLALKRIPISGGPAVTICAINGPLFDGAIWGPDDTIVFSSGREGLWRVSAAGGEPEQLTTPDGGNGEVRHGRPDLLPGGRTVLFDSRVAGGTDDAEILARDLQTGEQKILIRGGTHPRYLASGHLVYAADGSLRVVRFDPDELAVRGTPVPITESVRISQAGTASFAVASTGTLVYIQSVAQNPQRALVWVDRQGREEPLKTPPRGYVYPRISPDGTRVALDIRNSEQEGDIWLLDVTRDTLTRLTIGPGMSRTPVWSPDGRRLAFLRGTPSNLYWQAADGTGAAERLTNSSQNHVPSSFAPDSKRLVFRTGAGANLGIDVLSVDDRRITPLIQAPFIEQNGEVSPDGRWLAYESNESGQFQIHVRPFPNVDSGRWQISPNGGTRPMWARNGRELFYVTPDGALMAVPVETASTFSAGTPVRLFAGPFFEFLRTLDTSQIVGRTYDISPDGRRFLLIKEAAPSVEAARPQVVVVQNWHRELTRLAPAN